MNIERVTELIEMVQSCKHKQREIFGVVDIYSEYPL